MRHWGVFNDEGMIDGPFMAPSAEHDAKVAALGYRVRHTNDEDNGDPHAMALEICADHEEEPSISCSVCFASDE